jgi:hypothetical protein
VQIELHSPRQFGQAVLRNLQRTSTHWGILKAEAVYPFTVILSAFNVQYVQDMLSVMDLPEFEASIRGIPGQTSGVSLAYFCMMCGSERHVKPNRLVVHFFSRTLNRKVHESEVQYLVTGAAYLLHFEYPWMTPRILDNLIWMYERERSF